MKAFTGILAATAAAVVAGAAAAAAKDRHIGQFERWDAFEATVKGRKVCYVASAPVETKPEKIRRDPASLLVSWWPKQKIVGQIKLNAGFPFRKDSRVRVSFPGKTYAMWTDGEAAWAENTGQDRAILSELRRGKQVKFTGTSTRGTVVTDTYSLDGISAAIKAAKKACGV